mmetsp:Transcript_12807/g.31991  ORF Transcript_12807/g.31991 Transcript_12807/m.31991 type:complete len:439 (+) Transcript_12807:3-1319(+)
MSSRKPLSKDARTLAPMHAGDGYLGASVDGAGNQRFLDSGKMDPNAVPVPAAWPALPFPFGAAAAAPSATPYVNSHTLLAAYLAGLSGQPNPRAPNMWETTNTLTTSMATTTKANTASMATAAYTATTSSPAAKRARRDSTISSDELDKNESKRQLQPATAKLGAAAGPAAPTAPNAQLPDDSVDTAATTKKNQKANMEVDDEGAGTSAARTEGATFPGARKLTISMLGEGVHGEMKRTIQSQVKRFHEQVTMLHCLHARQRQLRLPGGRAAGAAPAADSSQQAPSQAATMPTGNAAAAFDPIMQWFRMHYPAQAATGGSASAGGDADREKLRTAAAAVAAPANIAVPGADAAATAPKWWWQADASAALGVPLPRGLADPQVATHKGGGGGGDEGGGGGKATASTHGGPALSALSTPANPKPRKATSEAMEGILRSCW